ncbi:MAG: hypothetical protein K8I27_01140 [Planctomycetes bacterium]|nr:hypothetical protein [Planctomycetota bacterium]
MIRFQLTMLAVIASLATAVAAQQAPGPGDLIPRSGTIAYMTSDRPDALYRLFGRDTKGGWKLKSFTRGMMDKQHADDPDSEEALRDKQIFDYIFGSYEAVERVEVGLVDVTLDGPKYLVHLKTREGASINPQPEFLKEFLEETKEVGGVKYHLYRVPTDKPEAPDDSSDGEERREEPRNALGDNMYGMDRYYIASTPRGLLVANFETTMREALTRLSTGDYSDALSGREEFSEWVKTRTPHDFSVFIIGREIQNAVERLLPSEDQAGVDAEGIYRGVDKWLQFREYKYIVFDLDYDDAARGITVAASFKTRRPTRLLEKLAIEPAEFKLLKYVPDGAILTAGLQIGDAKQTFENLRELGYDVEEWANEINEAMRGGGSGPDMPPEDGDIEPKSLGPIDILKSLQDMEGESEPGSEGSEGEGEEGGESEIDKAMRELDEMLAEYGTSRDAILGALGTEAVVFALPNVERARAMSSGQVGFDDLFSTSDLGVAIAIKDVAKAKAILATARENDKEGAFRGFTDVGYQGRTFSVSPEQPYGWCFTDDALLVVVAMGVYEEDATTPVIAGLKAMADSATHTTTGGSSFLKEGSKFLELDFGAITRLTNQLNEDLSKRLDRYSRPPLDANPVDAATDLTFALRLKEYKDGVEVAVRIAGLPDFGQFLDGELSPFNSGGNAKRNAYNYTEDNLRTLSGALHRRVDSGEAPDLDAMLKLEDFRKGVLQVPFDARWQGDISLIGWTTLDQVVRDGEGKLPEWVEKEAADMIEKNEQQDYRSIVLAKGNIKTWLENWESGFIVAYQETPDTLGGHVVLYADGVTGWLSSDVLQLALDLNAKGEPVPAEERWDEKGGWDDEPRKGPPPGSGPRIKEDDPWFPGPK